MTLGDFLKRELSSAAPWNCSTLAADWCLELGHPDFAANWRTFTNPVDCEEVQTDAGSLVALWECGIDDGLPAVDGEPQAGDIAVICVAGLEAGAIFSGERWVLKAQRGLHFLAPDVVEVVKAWRP